MCLGWHTGRVLVMWLLLLTRSVNVAVCELWSTTALGLVKDSVALFIERLCKPHPENVMPVTIWPTFCTAFLPWGGLDLQQSWSRKWPCWIPGGASFYWWRVRNFLCPAFSIYKSTGNHQVLQKQISARLICNLPVLRKKTDLECQQKCTWPLFN